MSAEQTRAFAAALGAVAEPGDRIALLGPLGAGKTQFAKGFAAGLGVRDVVNSPSFTFMAEYAGRLPLFHQDLYRLSGAEDASAAASSTTGKMDGVTLIEWAERMPGKLDTRSSERRDRGRGRTTRRTITVKAAQAVATDAMSRAAQRMVGRMILVTRHRDADAGRGARGRQTARRRRAALDRAAIVTARSCFGGSTRC